MKQRRISEGGEGQGVGEAGLFGAGQGDEGGFAHAARNGTFFWRDSTSKSSAFINFMEGGGVQLETAVRTG